MRIFYDVDTQNDFMNKNGVLYVPDAELIKPKLADLTKFARKKNNPIVGSLDRHFGTEKYKHREGELQRWGGKFPDHCMDGTTGLLKISETKFPDDGSAICIPTVRGGESFEQFAPAEYTDDELWAMISGKKNMLFEKQHYDVFTNPAMEKVLEMADVKEAVVYGVATDYCVKAAVLGMQKRGVQCYVVEDAIKGVDPKTTEAALEEMKKAGAKFIKTKKILEEIVK